MSLLQESGRPMDDKIAVLGGALERLFDLLEAYSPVWYTEADRDLAETALRSIV